MNAKTVAKIRKFYKDNSANSHPDMPNDNMDFFTDEQVVVMFEQLCNELDYLLHWAKMLKVADSKWTDENSWVWECAQLQDLVLEEILLSKDEDV